MHISTEPTLIFMIFDMIVQLQDVAFIILSIFSIECSDTTCIRCYSCVWLIMYLES